MKIRWYFLITAILLFCSSAQGAASPLRIHVSILPQKFFVQQIAGDLARVSVLVAPGKSPATYSPTPSQVKSLANSQVFFRIGVPFENGFIHKIHDLAREVRIVDTRRGIDLLEMEEHDHAHHQGHGDPHEDEHHGEEHHDDHGDAEEDHAGADPHIWMDPLRVKQQADTIFKTLVELAPEHEAAFKANHARFTAELDALHREISQVLAPCRGKKLFVFHPSFGYFTQAYGLEQVAVEQMGKAPKGKQLAKIIKWMKQEKARMIFVQPQFDAHAAGKIAQAIQGGVVSVDPLSLSYMDNLKQMARTIAGHLCPQ